MRILIADDHALFREGLGLVLGRLYPEAEVHEARTVDEAVAWLAEGAQPDLVLLDLAMPGMSDVDPDGGARGRFAGVERVVGHAGDTPVVMVSAHVNPEQIAATINLGARGYILKSSSQEVLRHALSLVMSGSVYIPSSVLAAVGQGGSAGAERPGRSSSGNPLRNLTPRQRATLDLMMLGKSNKEIARELDVLESTVKAHVRVILNKLKASNRTQAVRIATDLGWSDPGDNGA